VAADGFDEGVAVRDRCGDVEAVVVEQAREPVAEEGEVLGDHDAHGSSALIVVGPPFGLVTASVPSSASTRRFSPVRPLPDAAAPPRPSSSISTSRREPCMRTRTFTPVASACLVAFAIASATTKYAAVSTTAGGRSSRSTSTCTGSGLRSASVETAASRPRSVSTGGGGGRPRAPGAPAAPSHPPRPPRHPPPPRPPP